MCNILLNIIYKTIKPCFIIIWWLNSLSNGWEHERDETPDSYSLKRTATQNGLSRCGWAKYILSFELHDSDLFALLCSALNLSLRLDSVYLFKDYGHISSFKASVRFLEHERRSGDRADPSRLFPERYNRFPYLSFEADMPFSVYLNYSHISLPVLDVLHLSIVPGPSSFSGICSLNRPESIYTTVDKGTNGMYGWWFSDRLDSDRSEWCVSNQSKTTIRFHGTNGG